jgi:DNA-binding PadR family transcriptional regulator
MRTRELKRIILKMFGDREFYGYDVHKKISALDTKIEMSRLYRVLNEMLREGLLEGRWEKSHLGPRKRVYKLGRKGKEELNNILLDAIKTVHMFYGKYVMNLPPKVSPVDRFCSLLVNDLEEGALGYLVDKYSGMHKLMIHQLHKRTPGTMKYFIKPDSVQMDLKLENLIFLDGTYNNVPLRNDYLDLLIVISLPTTGTLEEAFKEWHRVVKQDGRLTVLAPTTLIKKYEDPLTIGDFLEKHEHETIEKRMPVCKEHLQGLLETYFKKIKESEIIHMTAFVASEKTDSM